MQKKIKFDFFSLILEYQLLVESYPSQEKFSSLRFLALDFTHVSEIYSKVIINEYFLPESDKTIPSAQHRGVAGGSKYFVIFFSIITIENYKL